MSVTIALWLIVIIEAVRAAQNCMQLMMARRRTRLNVRVTDEFIQSLKKTEEDVTRLLSLPSAEPERLTDDDFETIRIHLSAFKERLCNQRMWEEAENYERLISRFMSFAHSQKSYCERKGGEGE